MGNTEVRGAKPKEYTVAVYFEESFDLENVKALILLDKIRKIGNVISYYPGENLSERTRNEIIKKEGFRMVFSSASGIEELKRLLAEEFPADEEKLALKEYEG